MTCPVDGCTASHPIEHVMCRTCWRLVPRNLRGPIWRAWERRQRFPGDQAAVAEHEDAKRRAIEYVSRRRRDRDRQLSL
jgi:hypothetical protein